MVLAMDGTAIGLNIYAAIGLLLFFLTGAASDATHGDDGKRVGIVEFVLVGTLILVLFLLIWPVMTIYVRASRKGTSRVNRFMQQVLDDATRPNDRRKP